MIPQSQVAAIRGALEQAKIPSRDRGVSGGRPRLLLRPARHSSRRPRRRRRVEAREAAVSRGAGLSALQVRAGAFERIYDPSGGESERWYVDDHTFVRDGTGTWHLFGITHAEPAQPHDEKHLAHATAPALHGPWTKQPFALSADSALQESVLWAPHVLSHDGRYWMFVCGGGPGPTEFRIQLATSDDCVRWTRHPENPLLVDGYEARDPMVLRVGDRWVMYYTATSEPAGGHHVVVATESRDLVHWSGRRIVYTDPCIGDMGGPTDRLRRRARRPLLPLHRARLASCCARSANRATTTGSTTAARAFSRATTPSTSRSPARSASSIRTRRR